MTYIGRFPALDPGRDASSGGTGRRHAVSLLRQAVTRLSGQSVLMRWRDGTALRRERVTIRGLEKTNVIVMECGQRIDVRDVEAIEEVK